MKIGRFGALFFCHVDCVVRKSHKVFGMECILYGSIAVHDLCGL